MSLVPEWAPNIHPLVVHFPIALLFAAALADALALAVRRRWPGVRYAAVGLWALGAVSLIGTFFTGRAAGDSVDVATSAVAAVGEHADWALWTTWAFGLYDSSDSGRRSGQGGAASSSTTSRTPATTTSSPSRRRPGAAAG